MKFDRIKLCKFENAFTNKRKPISFLKNLCVIKFNWLFLKQHKIVNYRQQLYLSKQCIKCKFFRMCFNEKSKL